MHKLRAGVNQGPPCGCVACAHFDAAETQIERSQILSTRVCNLFPYAISSPMINAKVLCLESRASAAPSQSCHIGIPVCVKLLIHSAGPGSGSCDGSPKDTRSWGSFFGEGGGSLDNRGVTISKLFTSFCVYIYTHMHACFCIHVCKYRLTYVEIVLNLCFLYVQIVPLHVQMAYINVS